MGFFKRVIDSLSSLLDVTITSPADNDLIAYDSASGKYTNQTAAQAGVATAANPTFTGTVTSGPIDATHLANRHVVLGSATPTANDYYITLGFIPTDNTVARLIAKQQGVGDLPLCVEASFVIIGSEVSDGSGAMLQVNGTVSATGYYGIQVNDIPDLSGTYLVTGSLSGYATESYVTGQGFITSSALSGLATESYVTSQGYITSSALSGYATESYVGTALSVYTTTTDLTTALNLKATIDEPIFTDQLQVQVSGRNLLNVIPEVMYNRMHLLVGNASETQVNINNQYGRLDLSAAGDLYFNAGGDIWMQGSFNVSRSGDAGGSGDQKDSRIIGLQASLWNGSGAQTKRAFFRHRASGAADGVSYMTVVMQTLDGGENECLSIRNTDGLIETNGAGFRFANHATAPSSPAKGQTYYDTADDHFYGWNGSDWKQLDN